MNFPAQSRSANALALAIVWLASTIATGSASAQPLPTLAPMIERVSPAVVNISVSGRIDVANPLTDDPFFGQFFEDRQREFQSAGSGVIVDGMRGLILTNHHVVENANLITVTLRDNRTAEAKVIGSDRASDLAVLQIDAPSLSQMQFGDSEALNVGDYVVAIGNPFGFSNTVTSGIVSGLGRSGINPDSNSYEDFIQTDASINPGNSGGALVDLNGDLVGVNSAIVSRGGGNIGIGFAIPVNMARNVMQQLVEFGEVRRGVRGVTIKSIRPEIAEVYELDDSAGAIVVEISPNSAAEVAGILVEDIIVSINGEPVSDSGDLRNTIGLMRPGDAVDVGIVRDGHLQVLMAVLGAQSPPQPTAAATPQAPASLEIVLAGVELAPDEAENGGRGLRVISVAANSPSARSGLREGDLITHINRQPVATLADARRIVESDPAVVLHLQRGNRNSIIFIP